MAILLGQASGILGGLIDEYSVKTPQSNELEGYKCLTSKASEWATVRFKCYRSINLFIINFIN